MEKVLISCMLSSVLCGLLFANQKSGVFIGADVGAAISSNIASGSKNEGLNKETLTTRNGESPGFDWAVKLGYQHYFTDMHGLRFYASYGMGHIYRRNEKNNNMQILEHTTLQRIDANLDYLNDFITAGNSSFGAFAGLFVGYGEYARTMKDLYFCNFSFFGRS